MTVGELKKILDAAPDQDEEVLINSYEGEPELVEYVIVFAGGEVWIVAPLISHDEYSRVVKENREMRERLGDAYKAKGE